MAGILILWQMPYLKHLLYPFKVKIPVVLQKMTTWRSD
jgi:hypothetical protein